MATRIYLPSSGSPPVTPSSWNFPNQINPLTFAGSTTKQGTTLTTKQEATGTTSPTFRAMLRYVVGPLAAQTISGTVNAVIRAYESNTGANATLAIAVKIIQSDGSDRAVLLNYTASDSATSPYEFTTTLSSRRAYNASEVRPIPLTSQSAQAGDYLVIELGFRSATTTSRNIQLRYGDAANTDLADGEGETNDYNPWVEFSADIAFLEQHSGSGAISGNGTVSGACAKGGKGAATASGKGLLAATAIAGMIGLAAISGAGALSAEGVAQQGEQHYGAAEIAGGGSVSAQATKGAADSGSTSGSGQTQASGIKGFSASATISGDGSADVAGRKDASWSGAVSGGGQASSSAEKKAAFDASLAGGGYVGTLGQKNALGFALASGNGETVVMGDKGAVAIAGFSGGGSVAAEGKQVESHWGSGAVSGGGEVDATAKKSGAAQVAVSGGGEVAAEVAKNSAAAAAIVGGGTTAEQGQKAASGACSVVGGGLPAASGEKEEGEKHAGTANIVGGGQPDAQGAKKATCAARVSGKLAAIVLWEKRAWSGLALSGGGAPAASGRQLADIWPALKRWIADEGPPLEKTLLLGRSEDYPLEDS